MSMTINNTEILSVILYQNKYYINYNCHTNVLYDNMI